MDEASGWDKFYTAVVKEIAKGAERKVHDFGVSLGDWLYGMLNWPTDDWRDQLYLFVEHTRYYGLVIEPASLDAIRQLVESRVTGTGPFAALSASGAEQQPAEKDIPIQLAMGAAVDDGTATDAPLALDSDAPLQFAARIKASGADASRGVAQRPPAPKTKASTERRQVPATADRRKRATSVAFNSNAFFQLETIPKGLQEAQWGDFRVKIRWEVNPAPVKPPKVANLPNSHWVIQHVTASFDVVDADTGKPIRHPADDGNWDYWEAWEVKSGRISPNPVPGRAADDMFWINNGIPNTRGTITITGKAMFYPYTTLPAGFIPNNPTTHAHILRSTANGALMDGLQPRSFPAVVHTVIATWTKDKRGRTHVVHVTSKPGQAPRTHTANV